MGKAVSLDWVGQNRPSGTSISYQSVCYGNGLYVAVGNGTNAIHTSPEGKSWTARAIASNYWNAACYGAAANRFVVVASSGSSTRIAYSTGGTAWSFISSASFNNAWVSVAYGNGIYVAVGVGNSVNNIARSVDGINWTSINDTAKYGRVIYANGLFIIMRSDGQLFKTSTDGISWNTIYPSLNYESLSDIFYANGLYFTHEYNSGTYYLSTSADLINWSPIFSTGANMSALAFGNGLYVSVCSTSSKTSINGTAWKDTGLIPSGTWVSACYAPDLKRFVAVGSNSLGVAIATLDY